MRMLQVCNVGRITGGTAACAWTITQALPEVEHHVAFLSEVCDLTRYVFSNCSVDRWPLVDPSSVQRIDPDVVLLHNISPQHAAGLPVPTVQYVHSRGARAAGDLTVYCSRWLATACGNDAARVLYQSVPQPPTPGSSECRTLRQRLRVGRLCTPTARKWPNEIMPFYSQLATQNPHVDWEFVGCPQAMERPLFAACGGRAIFHPAGWIARSRLWTWDAMLYHHPRLAESFGRTAAESMRAGCIPILDQRGGFLEQIAPGTGFLCGGASAFCDALRSLSDWNLRSGMSRAAMKHANQKFSLQRFRADLLRLLRDVSCSAGPRTDHGVAH